MNKNETKTCPHCGAVAFLVNDKTTMQQGLTKTSFVSQSYECEACHRTFKTNEQQMEDLANFQNSRIKFKMEDMRPSKSKPQNKRK